MDFHDFPRFLGKSWMDLMYPPKLCASLIEHLASVPHILGVRTQQTLSNTTEDCEEARRTNSLHGTFRHV